MADAVKSEPEGSDEQTRKLVEAEAAARAAAESDARERAERIDKDARENALRLAERARQKFQDQHGPQGQETQQGQPGFSDADRHLAEAEAAARAAAEEQARQKLLEKDDEARKAAEEARKWEQQAIENERERKRVEKERKERELAGLPEPEPEPKNEQVKEKEEAGQPPRIGMKLPIGAASAPAEAAKPASAPAAPAGAVGKVEADTLDELLPKPALDFSRAPKGLDPNDPYNIYKPLRKKAGWMEIAIAGVLVVLLVGGGGFAWYKNWLPFVHHRTPDMPVLPKNAPVTKPVAALNAAKPATAAPASGSSATSAAPADAAGTPAAAAGNTSETSSGEAKSEAAPAPPAKEKTAETSVPEKKAAAKKEGSTKTTVGKSGKNHGKAETSSESKPKPVETVVAEDAPVIPAKVLHAVQPVYPPDAMRNYITGDVRIEAVVDPAGHIGSMNILVGPAALRPAAMDALKQYEYAPATQGGKAVASKVVVTVKFWFDP